MKQIIKNRNEVIDDLVNYWKEKLRENPDLIEQIIRNGRVKVSGHHQDEHMFGYLDYENHELLEACIDINLYKDIFNTKEFKHELDCGNDWTGLEKYLKIITK